MDSAIRGSEAGELCRLLGWCSSARLRRPRGLPVDEGSARDLRAMARLADEAAQLTGLCALAHRPNARAGAADGEIFLVPEKETRSAAWGERGVPVDEGSARDLRAAADLVDDDAQLTGLCALAHRPNARAGAADEEFRRCLAQGGESAGCPWTRARPVPARGGRLGRRRRAARRPLRPRPQAERASGVGEASPRRRRGSAGPCGRPRR